MFILLIKSGSPQCHLPTQLEDVSVSTVPGALSALEALCDYALYKSTFTLHYIKVLYQLHQGGYVFAFVDLYVSRVTQKVDD